MADKLISQMDTAEFDSIIEQFIERESQNNGEIPAQLFYEALENIFAAEPEEAVVELAGHIVGDELQLNPIQTPIPGIVIHQNEIWVHNIRFVIRLDHPVTT